MKTGCNQIRLGLQNMVPGDTRWVWLKLQGRGHAGLTGAMLGLQPL